MISIAYFQEKVKCEQRHILSIHTVLNGKFQILYLTQQPDGGQWQAVGADEERQPGR